MLCKSTRPSFRSTLFPSHNLRFLPKFEPIKTSLLTKKTDISLQNGISKLHVDDFLFKSSLNRISNVPTFPKINRNIPKINVPMFTGSFFQTTSRVNKKQQRPRVLVRFMGTTKSDGQMNTDQNLKIEVPVEPQKGEKWIAAWLVIIAGMVFFMVVLGGVTRLTESGLSITEWKPFRGAIPPSTPEEWEVEFAKYRESPEFQKINSEMTVDEFKFIYWMEWTHRQWGRIIGLAFALPLTFFTAKGWIRGPLLYKCLGLLGLGASQGALGWYMVKSGLNHETFDKDNTVPRVSQYRLAAHLSAAFLLYGSLIWMALDILEPHKFDHRYTRTPYFRKLAGISTGMIGLTAFSGAFVAGLDAGLIYNTFPKMGEQWIPEGIATLEPKYRNLFENDTTVQFDHRILGLSTYAFISYFFVAAHAQRKFLPPSVNLGMRFLFGTAALQVFLGITTLLKFVPVSLAASHQANSLLLLGSSLYTWHAIRRIPIVKIKK